MPHTDLPHGSPAGYESGCRSRGGCDFHLSPDYLTCVEAMADCPHWRLGRVTCAQARREWVGDYAAQRRAGAGTPLAHGTSNAYLLGCRDARLCPGDENGTTCSTARAEYRRGLARAAGIAPRAETIDAAEATRRVTEWRAQGLSIREIARRTGCGSTTIADLAQPGRSGRTRVSVPTMQRIVAARIVAPDPAGGGSAFPRHDRPDGVPTTR